MKKFLLFIIFTHLLFPAVAQNFSGSYRSENEFLNLKPDSTVEFKMNMRYFGEFYSLHNEQGKGKWMIHNKFLIIEVLPHSAKLNSKELNGISDSLRLVDKNGKFIYSAGCMFFEKNDSIYFSGAFPDSNGWISLADPKIDSVFIRAGFYKHTGFRPERGKAYEITLEEGSILNRGQIIFRIIIDPFTIQPF